MAIRYTPDELKHLRNSPLVVKPPGLPPAEQWMGPPSDTTRNATKPAIDRAKSHDSNGLLDQSRRPGVERHISRNSANPEDIILGPPKTSFMSATSIRNTSKPFDATERPPLRDADSRDRYNFRAKAGEGEGERTREPRNNTLRPKRADEDNEGWSTVKPRKSFGTEGAERFNGRMGVDRHRDDRRFKDREDRDMKERPRGFDSFSRDKDGEHDPDRDARRNGTGRGRNESWFKDKENADAPPTPRDRNSNGDRFAERKGGWRDKERDDRRDRGGRGTEGDREDRRWDRDRDQRQEREPEWFDQPEEEKGQKHTVEDFQKWREMQQRKDNAGKTPVEDTAKPDAGASFFGLEKPKVETPLEIVEKGPDKFFGMWAANKDETGPEAGAEPKEGIPKSKTVGKASRFTSFFNPQEEPPRRQTEPPPPMQPPPQGGLGALFANAQSSPNNTQSPGEKEAFAQLLQKLQRQTVSGTGTTPPANVALQPKPPAPEMHPNSLHSSEPLQQYRPQRQEDNRSAARNPGQTIQDLLLQRQIAGSQPQIRPDQMVQELVGQRQSVSSQASARADEVSRNTNTEFLMGLMQSAKAAPEPQRSEQVLLRMPPKADRQMQQMMMEREQEMHREAALRERSAAQRRPPPGFFDDPSFQRGPPQQQERQGGNPPQPTQILQRPPPPGMDLGWDRQAQLPPQHRLAQNIAPPPGLANGPNRGMPMPQQMFPPGFPMGNFPPPDVMSGPPRNLQMQPPPGFFNAPLPGFMPPGMGGYQGPEGMAFGAPFDGRGPPPQGFRRQ